MAPITRVTMIKVQEKDLDLALKGFETFTKTQNKDGAPYILSMEAGPAYGHVREQGFTFVTKSMFKSQEDMKFYEERCPAHEAYKVYLRENAPVSGLMMVCFEPGYSYSL